MHQRLRRLPHGRHQRLQAVSHIFRLRRIYRYASNRHRVCHLHDRQSSRLLRRWPSNGLPWSQMGHVHGLLHHHGRRLRTGYMHEPRRLHGRTLRARLRRSHHIDRWSSLCLRDGTSRVPRRMYRRVQHVLVCRRHTRQFRAVCDQQH